jgi:hypothetical protein
MENILGAVRYGIKISKKEKNPDERVTYIHDAKDLQPARMNFDTGVFEYGSWQGRAFAAPENNYPCMVKADGTEDYKLMQEDYTKKEDGAESDVVNADYAGNAMAAFKGGWLCQYETETDEYIIWSNVKYDDAYNARHRKAKDGSIREGFYRHIYKPTLIDGKARSISGAEIMGGFTAQQERQLCKANGEEWEQSTWQQWNYIICLLKIMAKTDDLQAAYGYGNCDNPAWEALPTGTLNDKGQFYGSREKDKQVKVFHTEALWGDKWERLAGLIVDNGTVKVHTHGEYNFTGEGYKSIYRYMTNDFDYGFVDGTVMTPYGRFPVSFNGSRHEYTADYGAIDTEIVSAPLVGGDCYNGLYCGACVNLCYTAGSAYWGIAPGLSCIMPNAAQQ